MKLSQLLPNREVDEFARSLAEELRGRFPETAESGEDARAVKRRNRAMELIYRRARTFRAERRLGVYGKARLGNTFKWELKEAGYSDAFVDEVTRGLVVSISRD